MKLQFFRISGILLTCFGCFLSANTADQKHVDLQKFYSATFLQTKTRPQTFETRKLGSLETKTTSRDSITA